MSRREAYGGRFPALSDLKLVIPSLFHLTMLCPSTRPASLERQAASQAYAYTMSNTRKSFYHRHWKVWDRASSAESAISFPWNWVPDHPNGYGK